MHWGAASSPAVPHVLTGLLNGLRAVERYAALIAPEAGHGAC
jgi:hypothetical protein